MTNSFSGIKDILNEYSIDIQNDIDKEAQDISKKATIELQNVSGTYKIRTGKYNKGWKVNTKKGRGIINCTIHNSTNWQLTHLLENGHTTRNGGRTKAFVHIRPIEEKYVNQYQRDVENIIKNGG